jgi:CHAT domain-containing protein
VAVLYTIVLPDRVELLLTLNGELHRRSVNVTQEQLSEAALRLREFAQDGSHERFLPYATRMYRWLVEPVRALLDSATLDALVIVPDGVLRTVPFAALSDGERYLIEDYAVATTPGLKLTAASSPMKSNNVLLAGVGQSVQGFAPLPQVTNELRSIQDRLGGRVLANSDYTKANMQAALATGDYNIVHMATHGAVSATPGDSFLLTYDGRLTMTDLESLLRIGEFRDRNIDLLTLSACDTAVGDERAALGLAGIAVKSGATSVLASLWKVDDEATATLMNRFYEQLQQPGSEMSKARALRNAQLTMLRRSEHAHPSQWAAFTLIGNWQ